MAVPAFAQSSEKEQDGLLSFSLDLYQVGPSARERAKAADAGNDDTEATQGEKRELLPIKIDITPSLYGLFDYSIVEGGPDTFDMSGAYIRLDGKCENCKLSVMANAAIADSLTWAYIDLAPWEKSAEKFSVRFGRFAVPLGLQIPTFPYELSSIDYSLIVKDVTDVIGIYDMGVMFHGNFKIQTGGINYAIAILNGEFIGSTHTNDSKSFCVRLGARFTPELEVGASYYRGTPRDAVLQAGRLPTT